MGRREKKERKICGEGKGGKLKKKKKNGNGMEWGRVGFNLDEWSDWEGIGWSTDNMGMEWDL